MKGLFSIVAIFCLLVFADIELEKRILYDNKIEILIPKEFKDMPEKMQKIKYPGANPPKLVLSNERGTVNIAFNHTGSIANQAAIESYLAYLGEAMKSAHPDAEWKGKGIGIINGKKVGYLKLMTEAADQLIYNYIFFTDVDNKLFIGTFNCIKKLTQKWEPVAEEIVKSFRIL
jgi:hypothetical protein